MPIIPSDIPEGYQQFVGMKRVRNAETGAILVDVDGVFVELAEVDVDALVAGIAGNKTLANVVAALGSPAQSMTLVGGPSLVTVDDTLNGKTLAALLGRALSASLKRLTLVPASAGAFWAAGNASAASAPLPSGGVELEIAKAAADGLRFFADPDVDLTIVEEG